MMNEKITNFLKTQRKAITNENSIIKIIYGDMARCKWCWGIYNS